MKDNPATAHLVARFADLWQRAPDSRHRALLADAMESYKRRLDELAGSRWWVTSELVDKMSRMLPQTATHDAALKNFARRLDSETVRCAYPCQAGGLSQAALFVAGVAGMSQPLAGSLDADLRAIERSINQAARNAARQPSPPRQTRDNAPRVNEKASAAQSARLGYAAFLKKSKYSYDPVALWDAVSRGASAAQISKAIHPGMPVSSAHVHRVTLIYYLYTARILPSRSITAQITPEQDALVRQFLRSL